MTKVWDLTRKPFTFYGWSWFEFNNLGLALGITLKFYFILAKRLKVKGRKFTGEFIGEKMVGEGVGGLFASSILNRVYQITGLYPKALLKNPLIQVFSDKTSEIFKTTFYGIPPGDCFCSAEKYFTNKILQYP